MRHTAKLLKILRFQEDPMPRRSILSVAERDSLLALPATQDELIRHYTLSETGVAPISRTLSN